MSESAWVQVCGWWLAFGGSHMLLSSPRVRVRIIGRIGARSFQGLYSLIALVTFVPLVRAFWHDRHGGPLWWHLRETPGVRELTIGLSFLAFVLLVASFFNPSPAMARSGTPSAHGLLRITRHPLFVAFALWASAHLLVNGWATDVAFFGGFMLFALIGAAHQDSRLRREPGMAAFFDETSLLPFGAILSGRNRLVLSEIPWLGGAIGLGVACAVYVFHARLFGV